MTVLRLWCIPGRTAALRLSGTRSSTGLVASNLQVWQTGLLLVDGSRTGAILSFICSTALCGGGWAFNIASINVSKSEFMFGYGGYQEARGWTVTKSSRFYVENVLEELDSPGEYFLDSDAYELYYMPHANSDIDALDFVLPALNTLVAVKGCNSTALDIQFDGFEFSQTRSTFLSEPYIVPSSGDWSVYRGGALAFENVERAQVTNCKFNQTGGNAIVFSAHVANSTIADNNFDRIGDSAIVFLGAAAVDDGTEATYPNNNLVLRNHVHNYGVFGKQVSAFFQALSANTTLLDNVFYEGPRAHINFNDGFGGNNLVEGNLLFSSVQETFDHGPFNSWDRMPYWTMNGVNDGFDSWRNVSKPKPGASIVKAFDVIKRNFVFTDNGATRALDHDDGSQFFEDADNVLVYSGVKNFLGNSKTFRGNLIVEAGAGENIGCFADDSSGSIGNSNHSFINNTCSYVHAVPYPMHPYDSNSSNGLPGSPMFRNFVRDSSFATANNSYHVKGGRFLMQVPLTPAVPNASILNLSLEQVQTDTAAESGSTERPPLAVHEIVQRARALLQMPLR